MLATLKRIPENCDPYIFFHRVRPFIHGWDRRPIIYEGVEEYQGQPQIFRGETGAQSSIIPMLDALLGITHLPNELTYYLEDMLNYMPPNHRKFIAAIKNGPSVRQFINSRGKQIPSLVELYNTCVSLLHQFRSLHLQYARDYIFNQVQAGPNNPTHHGTGGTPFMDYLKKHCDETLEQLI
jgi:indoleamine 2,3-dioxygenase